MSDFAESSGELSSPRSQDGHLLSIAGFITGLVFTFSAASQVTKHIWEPQGLIIKQWIAVGAVIVPYVALYSVKLHLLHKPWNWFRSWPPVRSTESAVRFILQLLRGIGVKSLVLVAVFVVAILSTIGAPTIVNRALVWLAIIMLGSPYLLPRGSRTLIAEVIGACGSFIRRHFWSGFVIVVRFLLALGFIACAAWLSFEDNRRIALALGVLQTVILLRLTSRGHLGLVRTTSVLFASIAAWTMTIGYSSTPLDQWLLASTATTALAPIAFVAAFVLVLGEFASIDLAQTSSHKARLALLLIAIAAFAELGLRTDHLLSDWLPFHRSFWVAPAEFIRDGAWPLWDYPTQYGVLSALSLAYWPGHNAWQALYLQTAAVLGFVAIVLFSFLRQGRSGAHNFAFALIATCAVIYSSQAGRFPMGWRLYPQIGLRFQWVIAIFALAYFLHKNRERPRWRLTGYVAGYTIWAISLAWSIECGFFTSCAWLSFVIADLVVEIVKYRQRIAIRCVRVFGVIAAVPLALYVGTELVFRYALHHGPDWTSFFEFSAAYQSKDSGLQPPLNVHGTAWTIMLMLIGIASVAIAIVRQRRYESIPVVAACWFGVWGSSVYFVGETYEVHGNGLAPVFATAIAVLFALQRLEGGASFLSLPTRAVFAPLFIILIAFSFGEPRHIESIRAPFVPGFSFDSTANFPAIHGELADLLERAKVGKDDRVVLPIPYSATKISLGLTLPFVRGSDGRLHEQIAWLPISPVGPFDTMYTLSYDRRQEYFKRYFRDVKKTGWFVTYRRHADCNMLIQSLRTVKTVQSANYEIVLCASPAKAARPHSERVGSK